MSEPSPKGRQVPNPDLSWLFLEIGKIPPSFEDDVRTPGLQEGVQTRSNRSGIP